MGGWPLSCDQPASNEVCLGNLTNAKNENLRTSKMDTMHVERGSASSSASSSASQKARVRCVAVQPRPQLDSPDLGGGLTCWRQKRR